MTRQRITIVVGIHNVGGANLLLIADALGFEGLGFGARQGREQKGGQNGDDGDDDEQLDQRKGAFANYAKAWPHHNDNYRAGLEQVK